MARTYHLEELRRNLFLLIAGVMAVAGLLLASVSVWVLAGPGSALEPLDYLFVGLPLVLFGGLGAGITWLTLQLRLELSETGVRLHVLGATLEADWSDVRALEPAFWGPLSGEALVLRRPARVRGSLLFGLVADPSWRQAIPLAPFALPLRGSRLEAELRLAAPQLFETPAGG